MRSYRSDVWLTSRDGHYTKVKAWAWYWKDVLGLDITFDMLIPAKSDLLLMGRDLPLWFYPIVHMGYKKNVAEQRTDSSWIRALNGRKYDVVICGHVEYASELRRMYPEAQIIVTHTHGPLLNEKYLSIHHKGIDASNAFLYNGNRNNIGETLLEEYGFKMHPLYNFVDARSVTVPRKLGTQKILFMSRLSDPSRFDIEKMKGILTQIAKKHQVFYTDPSESGDTIPGAMYMMQNSKEDFIRILDLMDTVVVPYSNEVTYSTSYFEALARGKRVISLRNFVHFTDLNGAGSIDSIDEIPDAIERDYDPTTFWNAQKYYVNREYIEALWSSISCNDFTAYRNYYGLT